MPTCPCGVKIFFAGTPAGRPMPVETGTVDEPDGNLAVWRETDGDGKLHCRVLKDGETPLEGQHRGWAHWARCPHADQHRKPRPS